MWQKASTLFNISLVNFFGHPVHANHEGTAEQSDRRGVTMMAIERSKWRELEQTGKSRVTQRAPTSPRRTPVS